MTDTPELNAQGPNLTPTHNMINAYLGARLLETGVRGFDISQQAEHEHGSRCIMCPQLTARLTHRPSTHSSSQQTTLSVPTQASIRLYAHPQAPPEWRPFLLQLARYAGLGTDRTSRKIVPKMIQGGGLNLLLLNELMRSAFWIIGVGREYARCVYMERLIYCARIISFIDGDRYPKRSQPGDERG
jgi:hypothetical protein